jgi:hypothetical protein
VGGTLCGGARDDDWNVVATNPAITADWADLVASSTAPWQAHASLDLASIWNAIKAGLGYVKDIVDVVGPLLGG